MARGGGRYRYDGGAHRHVAPVPDAGSPMPPRPAVVLIVAFWAATLGVAFYRDVWPHLSASGPPPIAVDLSDEASQLVPVRWAVLRGDRPVGKLTTRMVYVDADDTFCFLHHYSQVEFDFSGARVLIPDLTTTTRVTRAGHLREQTMTGKLVLQWRRGAEYVPLAEVAAKAEGRVENGVFVGRSEIASPLLNVSRAFDPVPVPGGQVLNPLQPLNRVAGVRPGQRWVVHEIDPLREAVATLFREEAGKHGFGLPDAPREAAIAEVRSSPEVLTWGKARAEASCWVIDYRTGEARARTWVRVSDGRVLRQEAFGLGERVALERED